MNSIIQNPPGSSPALECTCGATAKANSSEEKRFLKRHPALCSAKLQQLQKNREFSRALAQDVKSVPDPVFSYPGEEFE